MKMGELDGVLTAPGPHRIAVVGSGISGLAAAWLLSRDHHVTLFEAEKRPGGHSHTVDVRIDGVTAAVDTGFLVFNQRTYPELCSLFAHLEIPVAESDMSFAVSLSEPDLEWAGTDLSTVFAQRRNLLRPAFWQMLRDILRFNRETTGLALAGKVSAGETLGAFLIRGRYGAAFRDWYLLPMAAAIWSCPTRQMLDYPLDTFVRFCHNHGLLQIQDRPRWRTVRGGSRTYVDRIIADLPDVRLGCPVLNVRRDEAGVELTHSGGVERFDNLVLACHSDQSLRLLGAEASPEERGLLGAVRYQSNRALLHTDTRLLPRNPRVWAAWNYAAGTAAAGAPDTRPVSVSYLINRLQPLPFKTPVVVSLNPFAAPEP